MGNTFKHLRIRCSSQVPQFERTRARPDMSNINFPQCRVRSGIAATPTAAVINGKFWAQKVVEKHFSHSTRSSKDEKANFPPLRRFKVVWTFDRVESNSR
jgi:hypothetical protein